MAVRWFGNEVDAAVRQAAMRGVIRGTENLRNTAISLILNTPKTGRVYKRRTVSHQASAPGEPPASDTGLLVNSIETNYDPAQLAGFVRFGTAYAAALEYGTQHLEPRPFARPAVAVMRGEIEADVANEIRSVTG